MRGKVMTLSSTEDITTLEETSPRSFVNWFILFKGEDDESVIFTWDFSEGDMVDFVFSPVVGCGILPFLICLSLVAINGREFDRCGLGPPLSGLRNISRELKYSVDFLPRRGVCRLTWPANNTSKRKTKRITERTWS